MYIYAEATSPKWLLACSPAKREKISTKYLRKLPETAVLEFKLFKLLNVVRHNATFSRMDISILFFFFKNLYIKETYIDKSRKFTFLFLFFFRSINAVGSKSCSKLAATVQQRWAYIGRNICVSLSSSRYDTENSWRSALTHRAAVYWNHEELSWAYNDSSSTDENLMNALFSLHICMYTPVTRKRRPEM